MTDSDFEPSGPADLGGVSEDAAVALDAYQGAVLKDHTATHRESLLLADILFRTLLRDLASYADERGIDFDAALNQLQLQRAGDAATRPTAPRRFEVGEEVRMRTYATINDARTPLVTKRGYVAAVHSSDTGAVEYSVCFPGVPAAEVRVASSALDPTSAFPHTITRGAVVTNAADAEKTLVTVAARILRDLKAEAAPSSDDLADRDQLATALATWAGSTEQRVLHSLNAQISVAASRLGDPPPSLAPAVQPAADDFPQDLADGIPAPETRDQPDQTTPSPSQKRSGAASPRPKGT